MRRLVAAAAVLALAGCGASDDGGSGDELSGTVTVFAAASLTDVFTELGARLEAEHPGLTVQFNFAGSSALATQLTQGAPADVFAPADTDQMDVVTNNGIVSRAPVLFATNQLQIAVPPGNPGGITGLADLADPDKTIALCAPEVPCGAAAEEAFDAAGLTAAPDTLEEDVKAALTKVQLGEVDAALVYVTDVRAAGDAVEGIAFPEAAEAVNGYPICTLTDAPNPAGALAFAQLVTSEEGREVLDAAGFTSP
ncbi:molybdate ABC transporter substrate-binding protein [Modestobacter versicolor]|uniref:Molybdate transport system substrate-binding protein n=1 Tax=Modestobacter versicolor TaxID=429133 RepID=A0A839Y421_9ACTN|nr:molybdate ABC transporter substrate-binding protein [Modestobacter versicolor]MBB3677479.1 molybdate transport system substrate-binding protein [Modestobacter versicolor]